MFKKKVKILVSGCSFTSNQDWPNYLTNKSNIVLNLGLSGSGNYRISNSIISNCTKFKPDFVFILWSGMHRLDYRYSKQVKLKATTDPSKINKKQIIDDSYYELSGGRWHGLSNWIESYNNIKDPSWPDIKTIQEWNNLPSWIKQECLDKKINLSTNSGNIDLLPLTHNYFLTQYLIPDKNYFSEVNFQHIMNCHDYLTKHNVPYRFSFIYDIWKNHLPNDGQATKKSIFYKEINWSKFITLTPYEYGVKNNLLSDDQYHLTKEGMVHWITDAKKQFLNSEDCNFLV